MSSVKHFDWGQNAIACTFKFLNQFIKERFLPADGKAFYIFEYKCACTEFGNYSHKFAYELISRVIESTMADQGKALTRCPTEYAVDDLRFNTGDATDIVGT